MTMRAMSPREARLVAVLGLVAALALIDMAVVQPIVDGFAARAETRRELAGQYLANDRVIAAIPRLARAARAATARAGDFALAAPDAGAASEALRERMQAAITAAGGDFRGGDDVPPGDGSSSGGGSSGGGSSGGGGRVAARIAARLSGAQLGSVIARIENGSPAPIITGVTVSAGDALVTGRAATMDVTLEAQMAWHVAPAR